MTPARVGSQPLSTCAHIAREGSSVGLVAQPQR